MNAQNGAQSLYGLPMCPIGGRCDGDCGRTSSTCFQIFGPEADHIEALRINAELTPCRSFGCGSPQGHPGDHDTGSLAEQIARQNAKNATQQPTREARP